jgi:hypothetical protein
MKSDEEACSYYTDEELKVGDIIELYGHYWYVEKVVK